MVGQVVENLKFRPQTTPETRYVSAKSVHELPSAGALMEVQVWSSFSGKQQAERCHDVPAGVCCKTTPSAGRLMAKSA